MVKQELEFEKDPDNKWYVILPEWTGDRADLEMVLGADKFLDMAANGKDRVFVTFSDEQFEGADELALVEVMSHPGEGADYWLENYKGKNVHMPMWLCNVTLVVFPRGFPLQIWID